MPGKKITKQQVILYMENRKAHSQAIAAAKAGFSERSARNIERRGYEAAETKRYWRTRRDPFEHVWEEELIPLLSENPDIQAKTLLEYLQEKNPELWPDQLLRTLQRRVKNWRAVYGPEKEVIFRQKHYPAEQGISDFTHAGSLKITIQGEHFQHLLYHYRLTFSGWEYAQIVLGGESFTALAEGLQNALWMSGGVPETHRTDSLAAAYKNLSEKEKEGFTESYQQFCVHYGMKPTRNNKGVSHENGTIEAANRHLKARIHQALILRGSRDFSSIEKYRDFLRGVMQRHNQRVHRRYLEERVHLRPLPKRKTADYTEERVVVTSGSTIYVRKVLYSVPSRLIGMSLKVHLYDDRLECFIGADRVATLTGKRKTRGVHQRSIDYRHVIGSLLQKPQSFRNYIYKEEMFPTPAFRHARERLDGALSPRKACREYVGILKEAAEQAREPLVHDYLEACLNTSRLPSLEEVQNLFVSKRTSLPLIHSSCEEVSGYSVFFGQGGVS